jgi:hypothetical protein
MDKHVRAIHIQCRTSLGASVNTIKYDTRINWETGGGVVTCLGPQHGRTLRGPIERYTESVLFGCSIKRVTGNLRK